MSKFFVGQRVRCIRSTKSPQLVGEAQSIPEGLDPIDDSRDLTTWDACAWRPKDARVSA